MQKMYHPHQGKSDLLPSRTAFSPERQLFLQGGNTDGDSGLVLSTDAKPRLKWTPELHQHFIEAVNQLGGPDKATPKTVMRLMGIPGLTLYHLKSHLQKYRLSKNLQVQSTSETTKNVLGCLSVEQPCEVEGSLKASKNSGPETNKAVQISDAILMQIEVQRQLNEQLEVQRRLQLRIEAQGKYLQSVLEKTQKTLGKQNMSYLGLDAAEVHFSELVSKVSNECLIMEFPTSDGIPSSDMLHPQTSQFADCLMGSCLTSCGESQKNQEIHNPSMRMMTYQGNPSLCAEQTGDDTKHGMTQFAGNDRRILVERDCKEHSVKVKNQRPREGNGISSVGRQNYRDMRYPYLEQPNAKRFATEQEKDTQSRGYEQPGFKAQLDLNTKDDTDAVPGHKVLDLNGFGWS
ncbi:myb-related protein 2-like [Iris pallida]|uniref:Myb-related protein 2-like n=1 Tax=Iris pallida TaxID=29817 RepID=A0AAX6GTM6_IRIPA|nr:myb-related protein 2-like [Iris pallida]